MFWLIASLQFKSYIVWKMAREVNGHATTKKALCFAVTCEALLSMFYTLLFAVAYDLATVPFMAYAPAVLLDGALYVLLRLWHHKCFRTAKCEGMSRYEYSKMERLYLTTPLDKRMPIKKLRDRRIVESSAYWNRLDIFEHVRALASVVIGVLIAS